jgi:hypothetical protein
MLMSANFVSRAEAARTLAVLRHVRWCGIVGYHTMLDSALRAGYDTLQFVAHGDQQCGVMTTEIVFTRFSGTWACDARMSMRCGWNASRSGQCVGRDSQAHPHLGGKNASLCMAMRCDIREAVATSTPTDKDDKALREV